LRIAYPFLATREAFTEFVAHWEACTLPKTEWSHPAHIAVGAYHCVRWGPQALARIREGILRYNAAVGTPNTETSGYHETLTRFWTAILAAATKGMDDDWLAACRAVEEFGENRNLYTGYYSFDVVRSAEARRDWIPPDLKPLP
jgi:hypothetical protein